MIYRQTEPILNLLMSKILYCFSSEPPLEFSAAFTIAHAVIKDWRFFAFTLLKD
jgi:hypothetical protein